MAKIGYARVSTLKQDLTEQLNLLRNFGCEKIFYGKYSGSIQNKEFEEFTDEDLNAFIKCKENEKKQLNNLLNYVREDDIVVVTKLDRLGRSLNQLLRILDILKSKKVGFIALSQGIDTTKRSDPMAMAMIHLLGLFAELERNFIVDRTQEGKRTKIAAGNLKSIGGRPKKLSQKDEEKLIKDIKKNCSINILANKYSVSRATISRYKKRVK
ncbi:resolvase [Rodentibacter caecimuris]|uniref:Resolvase n=1 Tax=Rodentibacter caecimuris TaxID=1796644 RepID=A0A1V3KHI8_9PAST|nr:recombinase family protein [Rodentibacter heylii]OOF77121.1 resolvase [Rodentibacter heylii]